MKHFEFWKVKRELWRIWQQLRGGYDRIIDPFKQRNIDNLVNDGLPTSEGLIPLKSNIAIYLIFQPHGLSHSSVATCRWLVDHGYSPLVISNASIREVDLRKILEVCWRLVERPNFGYDFGGYRDGLICLRKWSINPNDLLILNDSVWLPVSEDRNFFSRLSSHPSDVLGAIQRERNGRKFLESYFYRIRGGVLANQEFQSFWSNLKLTSNKYYVIRRGERGFSEALAAAELSLHSLYDTKKFLELVSEESDEFLVKTLTYASYVEKQLASRGSRLLDCRNAKDWRALVLEHISSALQKGQAYSTFPYAMVKLYSYPFLKKSTDRISKGWREQFIKAVNEGDIPTPDSVCWSEIIMHDKFSKELE